MMSNEIENLIQFKGKTASRITPQDIEASIVAEYCFTAADGLPDGTPVHQSMSLLTIVVLVLKNGFTVTGESACASPENFDAEIGQKIAAQTEFMLHCNIPANPHGMAEEEGFEPSVPFSTLDFESSQ